jgi:hypothetical protein
MNMMDRKIYFCVKGLGNVAHKEGLLLVVRGEVAIDG